MQLSVLIRPIRESKNISQKELAEVVGISAAHLSGLESGKKNLNNHLLERISNALDVEPQALIGSDDSKAWANLMSAVASLTDDDLQRVAGFADALRKSSNAQQNE